MASASAPPCTLFQSGDGSRASTGLGPTGVAGVLRVALQRKALQSLMFSPSATLQHLQHPSASCVHAFGCAGRGVCTYARGFGPVASVASVANDKCIYKSITSPQHASQRLGGAPRQGVADRPCSIAPAAPQAIKYPRIFKGLRAAQRVRRRSAGNGVLAVSAPAFLAARADIGQSSGLALDQVEASLFGPDRSPVASDNARNQSLSARSIVNDPSSWGAATCQKGTPPSIGTPHPRPSPGPSSLARLAAPVAASRGPSGRSGENADWWVGGFRGFGVPESSAAITGGLEHAGSGEASHG